jgi:hypothetical protein
MKVFSIKNGYYFDKVHIQIYVKRFNINLNMLPQLTQNHRHLVGLTKFTLQIVEGTLQEFL